MPSFNFSVASKQTSNTKKRTKSTKKNIKTVVCIDLEANYFVTIDNVNYPINKSNYATEGVSEVYTLLDGKRICWTRLHKQKIGKYLPFGPGVTVKGNIIETELKEKVFDCKEIFIEKSAESVNALKFYKTNHAQIDNAYKNRY